jgi:tRNA pseudouridine38-40 synthase
VADPLKRVALWCAYGGARFHGYQGQAGLRTVQGELMRAFAAAGLPRNPVASSRTDKGVNARMQVLSARVERSELVDTLPARLNALLPDDLRVHLAREVGDAFHAAWSSTSKEYRYTVTQVGSVEALREAASLVPGTRDFRVFHFKTSAVEPRTVTAVELLGEDTLRFVGEGFGRHMVRMLVGALLAVSRGEVSLGTLRAGLDQQQNFHCPTAPPEPLTLWDVGYPSAIDPFTPMERAAFEW